MKLNLVQTGDPVLRRVGRTLTVDEVKSAEIQNLINDMAETMREAPGVGLAAPQIGQSLQLAVMEDRPEYIATLSAEQLAELERSAVDFQVIINPKIFLLGNSHPQFFEGCLSLTGFGALVRRAGQVRVECLNERAEPVTIKASGWYARILQHEIDHLNGTLYIDRMETRSFTTAENLAHFWKDQTVEEIRFKLGLD